MNYPLLKLLGRFFIHGIFWCGVLLFYTYFFGVGTDDFTYVLSFSLFLMPITIATTYVSIYKLIPDFLITKKYGLFGLYSIYTLIISGYLIVLSVMFGLTYLSNFNYENMAPISKSLLFVMVAVYLVVVVVSAFKLLKLNFRQVQLNSNLQQKILETQLQIKEQELHYLKMQIHPHFLFNTLNTIYGFALKQSDATPEMIIKLSNILDYILYQVQKPSVPINEELLHIQDYIDLEKIRFHDSLSVSFEKQIQNEHLNIPPMLLLPFVENSFKHGSIINGILRIKINITIQGKSLKFYIENSSLDSNQSKSGIGLENIKKRLNLLYPNQFDLNIKNENNTFSVHLEIHNL